MDEVRRRLELARRALGRLREALSEPTTAIARDASIQRFEFSFESAWRAAQRYLRDHEGLDAASPAMAIRHSHRLGLVDEAAARSALAMVEDRNLTVHTYDERLAEDVYGRLGSHAALIEVWLDAIAKVVPS